MACDSCGNKPRNVSAKPAEDLCSFGPIPYQPCNQCGMTEGYPIGAERSFCIGGNSYIITSKCEKNSNDPMHSFGNPDGCWVFESWAAYMTRVGVDCDGKPLKKGDAFASCANLNAAISSLNAAINEVKSSIPSEALVDNCTLKKVNGKLVALPQYKPLPSPVNGYTSVFRNQVEVSLNTDFDVGYLNIADYCDGDCRFNALRINVRQSARIDGKDGSSPSGAEINGGFSITTNDGFSDYRGYNLLVTDSDDGEQDREHSDEVFTVPVGTDGMVKIAHVIKEWPSGSGGAGNASDNFDHIEHVGSVRVYGCEYVEWGS